MDWARVIDIYFYLYLYLCICVAFLLLKGQVGGVLDSVGIISCMKSLACEYNRCLMFPLFSLSFTGTFH